MIITMMIAMENLHTCSQAFFKACFVYFFTKYKISLKSSAIYCLVFVRNNYFATMSWTDFSKTNVVFEWEVVLKSENQLEFVSKLCTGMQTIPIS